MDEIISQANQCIMNTYSRFPIVLESGNGCILKDINGKEYLDFSSGIAVNCLGHNYPGLMKVVEEQSKKMMHVSNLYWTQQQIDFAQLLTQKSGLSKAFFCNSGAEANEAAIKLARIYSKINKGNSATEIIAMEESFHGRTYGAISLTGQKKYQKNLNPLLPGVTHVPFNDLDAVKNAVNQNTCAIILEPIQGESGVFPANYEYIKSIRKLCDEENIVLVFDEVQTGIGRTGKLFAYENYDVLPDIVSLAKGIAAGFPMGAIVASNKVESAFTPGVHASTFGGNPLACAIASFVLKTVAEPSFLERVNQSSKFLFEALNELKREKKDIIDVRGKGLLVAVEISYNPADIIRNAMDKGLLLVGAGNNTIRFLPPLIVSESNLKQSLDIFTSCI